MGKARKDRKRGPRHNPVGLNGGENGSDAELNGATVSLSKGEALIQSVVDQLQSLNVDEKLCGLHMLSEVFDGRTLAEVVKNRIVRIVGPLLVDPSSTVRNSTAGAIRNLTTNGGPDFCDILIEQDVMTPLCSLIQKFGNTWQPKVQGTSAEDEEADTFIQAVNILWNLCESNPTALKYFNQAHLLPLLVRCLDINTFGMDVAITVAQCLQTVTEENKEAISEMQDLSQQLQQFLNSQSEDIDAILLQVLIAGILININLGGIDTMDPSRLSLIMAALSTALAYDQRRMLNQLTSELELNIKKRAPRKKRKQEEEEEEEEEDEEMESEDEEENGEDTKPKQKLKTRGKSTHTTETTVNSIKEEEKSISRSAKLLEAQQFALEILANLFSGDDEEGEMDLDDSDSEEMSEASFGEEGGSKEAVPVSVPSDILEAVVSQRLITKVWDKTQLPAENVCEILREHMDTQLLFNRLGLLRSRAFLCLQNMVAVMDLEELGGSNDLYNMWLETTKLVFEKTKADDVQLLEAATSVMRAAVQRLAEARAAQFSTLSESELQMLLQGETQCKEASVRANLLRIVACIGQLLTPTNSPHLPVIGKFLLDVVAHDAEMWVTAEALDCIYDVFGEDETDKAAFEIDLVNRLRGLAPSLKNKVRMQKKDLGDHYHVVITASTNLNRFIKYKSKRLASFTSNGHS